MSIDLVLITIIFIILILISYFLKSIRYSYPLVAIYFFYIITVISNNYLNTQKIAGSEDSFKPLIKEKNVTNNNSSFKTANSEIITEYDVKNETIKTFNKNKVIIPNSKPVVSKNPKPIVIDTNIINNISIPTNTINNDDDTNNRKADDERKNIKLKLNEIMICRDIYKRNPVKPGNDFINTVDTIFCYTKISNSGLKQQVKHVWFYENKEITTVRYNIKPSFNYRSWSRKKIMRSQIGKWRVDIIDASDELLGSVNFNINSIDSAY
tara:strand:+ start:15 stop:815 length:801 start_codon:yes stop_codon:yes gene_type:complete